MITKILTTNIEGIEKDSNVNEALEILDKEDISEIIIVDQGKYLFMLRQFDLLSSMEGKLDAVKGDREGYFVYQDDFILKAFQKLQEHDLSIIPVIDRELNLLGALRKEDVLNYMKDSLSISDNDSVIIIEQWSRDFALTPISNIIEQEGGKVLGVFIAPVKDQNEKIWVSISVSTLSMQSIILSLERHEYEIVARISKDEDNHMMKDRYESLMNFLNI